LQRLKRDTESGRTSARKPGKQRWGDAGLRSTESPVWRRNCTSAPRRRRWGIGLAWQVSWPPALAAAVFRLAVPPPPPRVSGSRTDHDGRVNLAYVFVLYRPGHRRVADYYVEISFVAPRSEQSPLWAASTLRHSCAPSRSTGLPTYLRTGQHCCSRPLLLRKTGSPMGLALLTGTSPIVGQLAWPRWDLVSDGRRVLFANGRGLYVSSPAGTESIKLASLPAFAWWPRGHQTARGIRFSYSNPTTGSTRCGRCSRWHQSSSPCSRLNGPPQECCGN